jgi:4-amino-4-deoxy-L-arabinose transferase-like glycosyltransferase/membrane-associated phospholipid phosphatase
MAWLQSIDVSLFRWINISWGNSLLDKLMPQMGDPSWLYAALLLLAVVALWKGGARGRLCVLMAALSLCLGNWLVCDTVKHFISRVRPFNTVPGAIRRIGMGGSFSMPSSHAANWFSATMVLFVYYRRTIWAMLPLSLLVALSRVYNGVHYPSDVLAGALLGAGYSIAIIWMTDAAWQWLGPRWFPLWWRRLPSIIRPVVQPLPLEIDSETERQTEWLRLGYVLTAFLLLLRLVYLKAAGLELSADEAYQWLWSKHLALSYYSKPLLIAVTQFLSTHLWGDNEFGVRFFSPVITAGMSVLILRFMARKVGGRAAFMLLLVMCASLLIALGAIVMTVDPLSVLFWTAAMIAGWRAIQPEGQTRQWAWVGIWMGLGLLSKYTNLYQCVCWIVFFFLWPPARKHLRRPGPYLALLIIAVSSAPIVIWNSQRHWITVQHVANDSHLREPSDRNHVWDFFSNEALVLNPIFFVAMLWAAIAFWRKGRRDPWQLYLFSMGAPLFLLYLAVSWHTRILPNWIAPSVVPLFCLMVTYWNERWKEGGWFAKPVKPLLAIGASLGVFVVVLAHAPRLINKMLHRHLPDFVERVHGWQETADLVAEARAAHPSNGRLPFVIAEHYGYTSEITFYLPEAKQQVNGDPFVFFYAKDEPVNQFYFWPDYLNRVGQNAIFVRGIETPHLRPDWLSRLWHNNPDIYLATPPIRPPPPPEITRQFSSVKEIGYRDVVVDGNLIRRIQLFDCRNLR